MMLTIESINPDHYLSTALAVYFARLSFPVWQHKYPEDSRPEKAIEAAEKALFAAATDAVSAAVSAAAATDAATDAVSAAVSAAAYAAAYAAADAAAYAAYAAAYAAAGAAAYAAYAAAGAAANALGKDKGSFAHHHLTQLLPLILWHKLNSRRSFGEPEKVFELLPEACREDFLFNLDSLR